MSFLFPKPKTPKPPNTPIAASAAEDAMKPLVDTSSLISTASTGLKRKANVMKTSLIGGAQ